MRIAFLIRSLEFGGTQRQLVALARGLHERGYPIIVIVFYSGGALELDLLQAGVPVRSLEKRGRWDLLFLLWALVKLIRRERPSILHSYLASANVLSVLIKALFPRIATVWGVRASYVDFNRYDWMFRSFSWLESKLCHLADLVIVNSYAGLDFAIKNNFPKRRMVVIPNGIDTDSFQVDARARERVREIWGAGTEQRLIGLIGRLDPMKDHPSFLQAAALLSKTNHDLRFVCVGDGPADYREQLVSLSEQLGLSNYVIWAGEQNDMPAVYNALDIVISSSYGEGFPNVIGEAMSCEVPCIVTNVGDSALIVGNTGLVVPPKDIDALKVAILSLVEKIESQSLDRNCIRQRIVSEFSFEQLIAKTEASLLALRCPQNA